VERKKKIRPGEIISDDEWRKEERYWMEEREDIGRREEDIKWVEDTNVVGSKERYQEETEEEKKRGGYERKIYQGRGRKRYREG